MNHFQRGDRVKLLPRVALENSMVADQVWFIEEVYQHESRPSPLAQLTDEKEGETETVICVPLSQLIRV